MNEKRKLPTKLWAGFVDGKADLVVVDNNDSAHSYAVLYPTREHARRFYKDVRRVEIREVKR